VSAYSPSVPRTAELQGLDRHLVRLGSALTALGRRRAEARARALAAASARASARSAVAEVEAQRLERLRDNAAQVHPLLLR
jgi:hypothetical protein